MEFLNIIQDGRRLKKHLKDVSADELKSFIEKLEYLLIEKEEIEKETREIYAAKLEKIAEIRKQLESDGITLEDLGGNAPRKRSTKGTKAPIKYSTTVEGQAFNWTGRGRMPKVFADIFEQKGSLEDCKV